MERASLRRAGGIVAERIPHPQAGYDGSQGGVERRDAIHAYDFAAGLLRYFADRISSQDQRRQPRRELKRFAGRFKAVNDSFSLHRRLDGFRFTCLRVDGLLIIGNQDYGMAVGPVRFVPGR